MNNLHHILSDAEECLELDVIYEYIDNKLDATQKHKVERHLADCEFCSDAMEGLEKISREKAEHLTQQINYQIQSGAQKSNPRIKKYWYLAAASISALFIGLSVYLFNDQSQKADLSINQPKQVPQKESFVATQTETKTEEPVEKNEEILLGKSSVETATTSTDKVLVEIKANEIALLESLAEDAPANNKSVAASKSVESDNFYTSAAEDSKDEVASDMEKPASSATAGGSYSKNALDDALAYTEIVLYNGISNENKAALRDEKETTATSTRKKETAQQPASAAAEPISSTSFDEGLNYYYAKNFDESLKRFTKAIAEKNQTEKAVLYKAMTLVQLNRNSEALNEIKKYNTNTNSYLYSSFLWITLNLKKAQNLDYTTELEALKKIDSPYEEKLNKY